jgi:hypothetical protein
MKITKQFVIKFKMIKILNIKRENIYIKNLFSKKFKLQFCHLYSKSIGKIYNYTISICKHHFFIVYV